MTSAPVTTLKRNTQGNIEGIVITKDDINTEIAGKIFIAADGVESRVAQMMEIDTTLSLEAIDSSCQYLVEEIEIDLGRITVFIGQQIAPGGYAWIFPKSESSANIGVAICPSKKNGQNAKKYLDSFMKSHFKTYKISRVAMGIVPEFNKKLPLLKGNLLLAGDAARLLDSLSGAGISNALISGSIAGEVAAQYLRGNAKLGDYRKRFMKIKARELYAYKLFRSLYLKATDEEFEKIIAVIDDYFPEKKVRDIDLPDVIFKLLIRNPGLLKMARYLIAK
jgi:digeranylgeranylglycerophospholipid reductase